MKHLLLEYLVIFFSFSFLFSCNINNEPIEKYNYSLLFNLIANSPTQKIYIYKSLTNNQIIEKNNSSYISYFYDNAKIEIIYSRHIYDNFTLDIDTIYSRLRFIEKFYKNNSTFSIMPNTKYKLVVGLDNLIVTGTTIVPGDFKILQPNTEKTITTKNNLIEIQLKWSQSYQAKGYIIKINYFNSTQNWEIVKQYTLSDTLFNYSIDFKRDFLSKGKYKFEILAFDENYNKHVIKKLPSAGINGVYGYFGSSVLKSVIVNIK